MSVRWRRIDYQRAAPAATRSFEAPAFRVPIRLAGCCATQFDSSSTPFFSDGLTEELMYVLSRMPPLSVMARTSSFQFKGSYPRQEALTERLAKTLEEIIVPKPVLD